VILINLLPHREAARKRKREAFFINLGISAVFGFVVAGVMYSVYQAQIQRQAARNAFLQAEIVRLDEQIVDIATLEADIVALRTRQKNVENLQGDRNLPVYLLTELIKQLPDGVYIKSMKQDNQVILLEGVAQSNERVSELLRHFAYDSVWLKKPELVEITAGTVTLTPRDQRRVANFSMRVEMKRASDQKKGAASSPASSSNAASSPASSQIKA
jgi:type IV pilus assembly protein PilN